VREADEVQDLRHLAADGVAAFALHLEGVGDVLGGGAIRKQLEVLEDAADVAPQQRDLLALEPTELAPADDDLAGGRLELLQHEPHERRLARAGRADDEDELALVDPEGDVAEGRDVRLVDLRDVLEDDHRRARRRRRRNGRDRALLEDGGGAVRARGSGGCALKVGVLHRKQERRWKRAGRLGAGV
jgi:hypothetical protein